MSDTNILRYKTSFLILPLAAVLALVSLGLARYFLTGDLNGLVIALLISFFSGISLLPIWTYRLVLGNQRLQARSAIKFSPPPVDCAYADITWVGRGNMRSELRVKARDREPFTIPSGSLAGGHKKVLGELSRHIPTSRFEPNLESKVGRPSRAELLFYFFSIGFAILVLISLSFPVLDALLRYTSGWGTAARFGGSSIQTASIDDQNGVWITTLTKGRTGAQVHHVLEHGQQSWDYHPQSGPGSASEPPIGAAPDPAGLPWLFYNTAALHWNGKSWDQRQLLLGGKNANLIPGGLAAYGRQVYLILVPGTNQAPVLAQMDPHSGSLEPIPLPASTTSNGLEISELRRAPDGSWLGLFEGPGQPEFYRLSESGWESSGKTLLSPYKLVDYTAGIGNQPWALVTNPDQNNAFYLTWLDAAGNWNKLSLAEAFPQDNSITSLAVDQVGRAWLGAQIALALGMNNTGSLALEQRYTPDNSTFPQPNTAGVGLLSSADGRIWAPGENSLAWIEAKQARLPNPLSDRAVYILGAGLKNFYQALTIPFMLGVLVIIFYIGLGSGQKN